MSMPSTSGKLRRWPPNLLVATRADLLRRLGRRAEAVTAYREALALVSTGPEQRFLAAGLVEVTRGSPPWAELAEVLTTLT
jgi:predicted RNA polymerase sigma factor